MEQDDNISGDEHESGSEHESRDKHETSPKKAKPRGPTIGIKAVKRKGPRHIEFDENNVPMGVWKKDFATELGVQARNIRIIFKKWKVVPKGKKETIWKHLKKKYKIKDDEKKEVVIRIVSNRYKDFKSRLWGIFIYKTRKPGNKRDEIGNPLLIYKQISKHDWIEFEKQANDPEFKSNKARESQKENKCPHYMGRAGYAGKKDEWFEDELTKLKASNPDTDPIALEEIVNESFMDRSFTWMKGHTRGSSDPPPETQEVIDNIHKYRGMQATGEFVPSMSDDVLTRASGKKEHTGRVRGVGGFVSTRTYFRDSSELERMYTKKELEMAKEEMQEKCRLDMMHMMKEMAKKEWLEVSRQF